MTHVAYVLTANDGATVYVGMTSDLPRRLREHSRRSWWSPALTVEAHECASASEARVRESELIESLRPTENRVRPAPLAPRSIPRRSPSMLLAEERLGKPLADHVAEGRREGASWNAIALDVYTRTAVSVTSETLRTWFVGVDKPKANVA